MGAGAGARRAIIFHRFFQKCPLLVCQRMHISHNRNLILGCPIKCEGLHSVGYGQILYQKTFRRALIAQRCMEKASEEITNGFTLRSQPDVVTYPDRFADKLGIPFWNTVWTLLGEERFLLPER